MKELIALFLSLVFGLALVGCGKAVFYGKTRFRRKGYFEFF